MWSLSHVASRICTGGDRLRFALLGAIERIGFLPMLLLGAALGGILFLIRAGLTYPVALFITFAAVETLSLFHRKPEVVNPFHSDNPTNNEVRHGMRLVSAGASFLVGWFGSAMLSGGGA